MPELNTVIDALDKKPEKVDWGTFNLSECQRCSLCKTRRNVILPRVVPNSKILFISEAPDQAEDLFGTALSGQRGQILIKCLEEVGINYNDCSFINVVQCKPLPKTDVQKDQIAACKDIVDYYINLIKPQIIVPLGNVALKRIAATSGIMKKSGHILEHKNYPNIKIIPVIDPIATLADPKNYDRLTYGISRVNKFLQEGTVYKIGTVEYVDTYEKFNHMLMDLLTKPYFAIDIETNVLRDWIKGSIICISFSNRAGHSYVLPWTIGTKEFYDVCRTQVIASKKRAPIPSVEEFCAIYKVEMPKFYWEGTDVKERLSALLAYPQVSKILHNYMFDYKFLEKAGLKLGGKIYDTMIMHYLLDESKGTHGLDDCCLKYTQYGEYWKGLKKRLVSKKKSKKNKKDVSDTYAIIPIDELVPYAGTDADVTFQIFETFYRMLEAEDPKLPWLRDNFLMPISELLMETEKNGIKIDREYLAKAEVILTGEIEKLDAKLKEQAPNVNYDSPKQLGHLLFTLLKLPVIKLTDSKQASTDEDVLEKLSNLHDIPKLLLERRKRSKLLNTYVRGAKEALWDDDKIHAFFHLCGTETGRLSSSNINMQNLPRNNPILELLGINIKNLFINSDPDYYIVETDYSQAELRLIAEYSRDRNLYEAFAQGRDPHAELAVRIYHRDRVKEMEQGLIKAKDIVTDEERQKAKTANFSLVYGKMAKNFAEENNIPYEEAIMIHTVYWETYKDITDWKLKELQKAYACGYFQSFFGRKRRLKKIFSQDAYIKAEAEREGINFLIQSQASDYTLYSTLKVSESAKKLGYRVRTISFVHDSAVYEVHKSCIQEFLTLLHDTMLHPPGISIPMESDVKVGNRLGSLPKWTKANGVWGPKESEKKAA